MAKRFFDEAKLLDTFKNSSEPTTKEIDLVLSMINDERFARYFFDQLDNPIWAPILEKRGYFLNVPEPIEVEKGSFRIPLWPAANYLVRVAKRIPDTILSIIGKIETENSRVQELLLDALAELPSEDSILVLEKIGGWLTSPFADFLPIKYGILIEEWISADFSREAISLFEKLITPVSPGLVNDQKDLFHSPLRFKSEHYWINDVIQKHYITLLNADCEGVFEAYDRQTRRYLELANDIVGSDVESYTGYRWRPDIPFRSSSSSDLVAYDVLVDGLRDALVVFCSKKPEKGYEKLSSYLDGDHIIFQRLGIFTLRSSGRQYPDLLDKVLSNRDYLENIYFHADYKGLMKDQFGNVSLNIRQKVLGWILEGPLDADARALRHAQWNNRDVEEADKQFIIERWRLEHLALVSQHLTGSPESVLDDLVAKYGKADTEEKPNISTSVSWGRVPSPVPVEELEKMSFDELVEVMIAYNEPSDSFLDPGESLAEGFGSIVQNNPVKYGDFAYRLTDSKLRFVYVYHFLNGISEAIKNNKEKLTDVVISLCESVVRETIEQTKRPSSPHEPNLLACQLEVGRLVENVLRSNDPYLTEGLLSRIKSILFILVENSDPAADNETGGFDPFTRSLNCVRGVAMHGIMNYLLYVDRQRKQIEKKEVHKPSIESDVQKVLQNKLDKEKDTSLAVHSVFGAYLPQLQYLDRGLVKQNIEKIFPELEDQSKYWQAAWDAYIFSSNVYGDVFKLLVHHYQRALQLLSVPAEAKNIGSSPSERLAQHIMFSYLNELTDFGHENKLLDLFFANAPDQIRSSAVFWLSKVLESQKPLDKDQLWARLWRLWKVRIEFAVNAERPDNFSQEISDYLRWLPHVPVDLGFLSEVLQQSIRFLNHGFSAQLMASFAANNCEKYPAEAVSLIYNAIKSTKEPWWGPEENDEETILKSALASGNSDAEDIAIVLINYRGEQGDFRWKGLISNNNKTMA
jgi:hypothetical protein